MSEFIKAALLGVIQGVTEFLPISSTGHLVLFEHWLGISPQVYGLTFDAALHLGTLLAVVWFYRRQVVELMQAGTNIYRYKRVKTKDERLAAGLILATLPAVVLGLIFESYIESIFRTPTFVAATLIIFSLPLIFVELWVFRQREISGLAYIDYLIIGLAQAIALFPGVSRSGIALAAGIGRGLKRQEAARLAFLLSIPIVTGAGSIKVVETGSLFISGNLSFNALIFFMTGMGFAAIFGYLTISYLLKFLTRHSLYVFVIYRILLGLFSYINI